MTQTLELLSAPDDQGGTRLSAPEVGTFTGAKPAGAIVQAGEVVGAIERLGARFELVVPAGVSGRVANTPPERTHAPTAYGQELYHLEPVGDVSAELAGATEAGAASNLVFPSPITGRFWHRPSPDDPPFITEGATLEAGAVVGLVEIMKTFTQVTYASSGNLPAKARITRIHVSDGGEVGEGEPLFEVEPA